MTTTVRKGLRTLLATPLAAYCRAQRPGARMLPADAWPDTGGYRSRLRQLGWSVYAASCLENRAGRSLVALRSRSAETNGNVYEVIELNDGAAILAAWRVDSDNNWTLIERPLVVRDPAVAEFWRRAGASE